MVLIHRKCSRAVADLQEQILQLEAENQDLLDQLDEKCDEIDELKDEIDSLHYQIENDYKPISEYERIGMRPSDFV